MIFDGFIRIFLPIYFALYFGLIFVFRSIIVARTIRKSPVVFPDKNTAYGLIGYYMKLLIALLFLYIILYFLFPDWSYFHFPIAPPFLKFLGLLIMFISFIWSYFAQRCMKVSWRIGIDTENKTELITIGLFKFSRNPVFFGMISGLLGLLLLTPNFITLIIFILGNVLIQIQVRLEEDFLKASHGEKYLDYTKRVRRWI